MGTVQAAGVLLQTTFPGNWHGQNQGIQGRVIEALTDQRGGRQEYPRGRFLQCLQTCQYVSPLLLRHASLQYEQLRDFPGQMGLQQSQVLRPSGEDDELPAFGVSRQDVRCDPRVSRRVMDQLLENALYADGFGQIDYRIEKAGMNFLDARHVFRPTGLMTDGAALHEDDSVTIR